MDMDKRLMKDMAMAELDQNSPFLNKERTSTAGYDFLMHERPNPHQRLFSWLSNTFLTGAD